jgi:hypothetical protein
VVSQFSPQCAFTTNDKVSFSFGQVGSDIVRVNTVPVVISSSCYIRIRVTARLACNRECFSIVYCSIGRLSA